MSPGLSLSDTPFYRRLGQTPYHFPSHGGLTMRYVGRCVRNGVIGHPDAMIRARMSRAESPGSPAQGKSCVLKDAALGRARPLRAGHNGGSGVAMDIYALPPEVIARAPVN